MFSSTFSLPLSHFLPVTSSLKTLDSFLGAEWFGGKEEMIA